MPVPEIIALVKGDILHWWQIMLSHHDWNHVKNVALSFLLCIQSAIFITRCTFIRGPQLKWTISCIAGEQHCTSIATTTAIDYVYNRTFSVDFTCSQASGSKLSVLISICTKSAIIALDKEIRPSHANLQKYFSFNIRRLITSVCQTTQTLVLRPLT